MLELPWTVAFVSLLVLVLAVVAIWFQWRRRRRPAPLPTEWPLTARPVFTHDERRVFHLLREALPHHVVLSKLPLVRFSQPHAPVDVRYWYELLGTLNVSFAVCSPNGRVLAAIDLEGERSASRRALQIKQSVLGACRVRYLRCPADRLPTAAELQLLVPQGSTAPRAPQPAPTTPPAAPASAQHLSQARAALASTVAQRRSERSALWHDVPQFQDSFFAPDSRNDGFGGSEFDGLSPAPAKPASAYPVLGNTLNEELGGVVVESTLQGLRARR